MDRDGKVDERAVAAAVTKDAQSDGAAEPAGDAEAAFKVAKEHLEEKAELWDWADDVEFLGASWVVFV